MEIFDADDGKQCNEGIPRSRALYSASIEHRPTPALLKKPVVVSLSKEVFLQTR